MRPKRIIDMSIWFTKYIPVVSAFVMLAHVGLLCIGVRGAWAENALIMLFASILYVNDRAFGFCLIHRLLGCYGVLVWWCMQFQKLVGFGKFLDIAHYIVALLGVVLFIILIAHRCQPKQKS